MGELAYEKIKYIFNLTDLFSADAATVFEEMKTMSRSKATTVLEDVIKKFKNLNILTADAYLINPGQGIQSFLTPYHQKPSQEMWVLKKNFKAL